MKEVFERCEKGEEERECGEDEVEDEGEEGVEVAEEEGEDVGVERSSWVVDEVREKRFQGTDVIPFSCSCRRLLLGRRGYDTTS